MANRKYAILHPGEQIRSLLSQVFESVSFYQMLGMEGIVCKQPDQAARSLSPTLESVESAIQGCQQCRLHQGRQHIVFGTGNRDATLLFVGEAPGESEDREGKPFVGQAGELLTRIIHAIELRREDVYVANIVKCRPPNNRLPLSDEIEMCEPYLLQQIHIIQPKIICALGECAAQTLLNTTESISRLRGQFYDYDGMKLMPTYHPMHLLRHPEDKRLVWEDMQMIQKSYNALKNM